MTIVDRPIISTSSMVVELISLGYSHRACVDDDQRSLLTARRDRRD